MRKIVLLGALIVSAASSALWAQSRTLPFEEYEKRIKSARTVSPLTSELFGEQVSLYNGSTEFRATDVSIPGNDKLSVALNRRLRIESLPEFSQMFGGFGNWDLDIPYIQGSYIDAWGSFSAPSGRCSGFAQPPDWGEIKTRDYWSGAKLNLTGQGEQDILRIGNLDGPFPKMKNPEDGHTYKLGTKDFHRIRCKATTANGFSGEGFIVLTPDGTTMTFDVGITRNGGTIGKPVGPGSYADAARTKVYLLVSSIVDKYGNSVNYSWNGDKLQSITSSDGRSITLTWTGEVITSASSNGRTWTYDYQQGHLSRVGLPDGSAWAYETINGPPRITYPFGSGLDAADPGCTEPQTGTSSGWVRITHPSGAQGRFDFEAIRHRRTGVPAHACYLTYSDPNGIEPSRYELGTPDYFDTISLTSKAISGAGLPSGTWSYQYEIPSEGRVQMSMGTPLPCSTCQKEKKVRVSDPDGSVTEYRFGTLYEGNDGLLLGTYKRDASDVIRRAERNEYVTPAEAQSMPFPEVYGYNLASDDGSTSRIRPIKSTVLAQDGVITEAADGFSTAGSTVLNRASSNFDLFGRAQQIHRFSSMGFSALDTRSYYNHYGRWVLGQVARATIDGIETDRADFNALADPEHVHKFGKLQYTLGYLPQGTLGSVTDGRARTIQLSDWMRNVPRLIRYPATPEAPSGATQSATVDTNGWIKSVTDEEGYTTGYDHDGMGRVNAVTYPAGDDVPWSPTSVQFRALTVGDPLPTGVTAGQWREVVSQGDYRKVIYFDGFWRPVLTQEYDQGRSGTLRSLSHAYNADGHATFVSYPSAQSIPASVGTRTTYDALDRPLTSTADSELGPLTTATTYQGGHRTSVRNARNHVTTTSYMAFDTPNTDHPVSVDHPEGVSTLIQRNTLGNALRIKRQNSGGTVAIERQYVYDQHQRLCKTVEPETGATIVDYDAADNLVSTASGLALSSLSDCNRPQAAASGRAVQRTYDGRNRVQSLQFPDGAGNQAWSYWRDGQVNSVVTANEGSQTTTNYQYNRRRLLKSETVSADSSGTWGVAYQYSPLGHLASHVYPTGRTIAYAPNALGQPTQVGSYATGVSYHPNGGMAQFAYGNGIGHTLTQNLRGLPDRSLDQRTGVTVLDDGYDYDGVGNIMAISDGARAGRGNRDMTYDGLGRLSTASSPMFGAAAYTYDALDNLRTVRANGRDHTYHYDASWRLTNVQNTAGGATVIGLGYDAQGNVTNKNGQGFRFDFGNRLREATGRESYRYDAHGRRLQSLSGTRGEILSIYGNDGVLRHQRDQRRAQAVDHVYLNGSLVARVKSVIPPFYPSVTTPGYSTSGAYTVQWTAVTGAGSYELQENTGGTWTSLYSGAGQAHAVSGRGTGEHGYRTRACNTAGCSDWSATANVSVQLPPSGVPVVNAPDLGPSGNYSVSWSGVSAATSYVLQESFNGGGWADSYQGAATSRAFSGRGVGSYAYRAAACNPAGCGAWSASDTVQVVYPPSTPALSAPANNHGGTYQVSWSGVAGASTYQLEERYGGGAWSLIHNAAGTAVTVSGRTNGAYEYWVRACNSAGCSGYSAIAAVQVLLPPTGFPSLSAPAQSFNGTYSVSWSAVSNTTAYQLEESINGAGWTYVYGGAGLSAGFSSRGNGGYRYRVRACNAAGCGPDSAIAQTTVTLPPATPQITYHHKHLIYYGSVIQGSCAAAWTATQGATTYDLRVYGGGGAYAGPDTYVSGDLSAMVCASQLEVRACNAAGCSPFSSPPSQQTVSEERYDEGEVPL